MEALTAWAAGSAWAALLSAWGWQITPVPALDSMVACAGAYAALRTLATRFNVTVVAGLVSADARPRPQL